MENSVHVNHIDDIVMQRTNQTSVVIDLGTGSGALPRALLQAGYTNLHLVDIEKQFQLPDMSGYQFYRTDLNFEPLPFTDGFADCVILNSTVEHLENHYFVIREGARVLKPGGTLLVTIPNIHSLRSKLRFLFTGNLLGYTDTNNHLSVYTRATFKKAFFPFFKIVDVRHSRGYVKIPYRRVKNGWFHKKIHFPSKPTKGLFSNDVIYILERL